MGIQLRLGHPYVTHPLKCSQCIISSIYCRRQRTSPIHLVQPKRAVSGLFLKFYIAKMTSSYYICSMSSTVDEAHERNVSLQCEVFYVNCASLSKGCPNVLMAPRVSDKGVQPEEEYMVYPFLHFPDYAHIWRCPRWCYNCSVATPNYSQLL